MAVNDPNQIQEKPIRSQKKVSLVKSTFCFVLASTFSALPQDLMGQDMVVRIEGTRQQVYRQIMDCYEGQIALSRRRIKVQLDDIDNACSLTDAQMKKLSVASKGAIIERSKKNHRRLNLVAKRFGQFEFEPGNPPEYEVGDDQPVGGRNAKYYTATLGTVESTRTWTVAIETTLTAEQIEKLNRWNLNREQRVRKSVVAHYVDRLDLKLFLSPDQRSEVTTWVDDNIGQQLVQQISGNERRQPAEKIGDQKKAEQTVEIDSDLAELLSRPQLDVWKNDFQRDFELIKIIKPLGTDTLQPVFKQKETKNAP